MQSIFKLNEARFGEFNIDLKEALFLSLLKKCGTIKISINYTHLSNLGFISISDNGYSITDDGLKVIKELDISERESKKYSLKDLEEIATEMQQIYPEGKKPQTTKYWRDNKPIIVRKLSSFMKLYGYHERAQILNATRKYVESFGDDKKLMRICSYFVMKDGDSELLTILENIDSIKERENDPMWAVELK